MSNLSNPVMITALATLITAIAGLLKVMQVGAKADQTHATLQAVEKNTNGTLEALNARLDIAQGKQASPAEIAARPPLPPGPTPPAA
jgi:hypothetical protein